MLDLIIGNSAGNVWYYKNIGDKNHFQLAAGKEFMLTTGQPLHVGVINKPSGVKSFEDHSGDRATVGFGDLNGNGVNDIVAGDANGDLFYFENKGTNENPIFAPGVRWIEGNNARSFVTMADWDGDGLLDIIFARQTKLYFFKNTGTKIQPKFDFAPPWKEFADIIPGMPIPAPHIVDWNKDGVPDLIVNSSYSYLYLYSHSYVEHGYAKAEILKTEKSE